MAEKREKKKTALFALRRKRESFSATARARSKRSFGLRRRQRFQKYGRRSGDDHPAWSLHFPAGYRLHEFAGSRHQRGEISSANDRAFIREAEESKCRTKQNGMWFIPIPGMKTRLRQIWRKRWKTTHLQNLIHEIRVPTEKVTEVAETARPRKWNARFFRVTSL